MKNVRVIVPVIICLALSFYIIGCGSVTSGGGGGGGGTSGGTTFKLVDPAIVGARMFMDTNFDGTWEVGEISSDALGSDSDGYITFSSLPTMDANIIPIQGYQGEHLGVSYEGFVARYFSTLESGALYITPATSLMTKSGINFRFTPEQVAFILTNEAGITVDAIDVVNDPMEGIDDLLAGPSISDNDLRKIRASICIYSFLRIMNDIDTATNGTISFEAFIASTQAKTQLHNAGTSIKGSLNTDLINNINTSIEVGASPHTVPKISAGDIAKTAVVITNRITEKVIATAPAYTLPAGLQALVADWSGQLGVRFYCQRNKNDTNLKTGMDLGAIRDSHGVPVSYNEVNTAEAWKINGSDNIVLVP